MLNFQTDYDEATGEQVLTCFLLPQMEYQAEQMGKLSKKNISGVVSTSQSAFVSQSHVLLFFFFKKDYLVVWIYTFFSVGFF